MDQSPVQELDVHEGLENTLIVLQRKLKDISYQGGREGTGLGLILARRIVVEGIRAQSRWFRAPATPRFRFYLPLNQLDD